MVNSGWWRIEGARAVFRAAVLTASVAVFACGGVDGTDGESGPSAVKPQPPTATKSDSSSSYIDSPYQTGFSQGTASVAQIPATLHMTPASLSFIVDREWAATGVSVTLKIVNGTAASATLDSFEIQEVDGPLSGAAQLFSFDDAPTRVTLQSGETFKLNITFKTNQVRSVVARVVVKSAQALNGELEAALFGKVTSF